jgi:hypothetical protein
MPADDKQAIRTVLLKDSSGCDANVTCALYISCVIGSIASHRAEKDASSTHTTFPKHPPALRAWPPKPTAKEGEGRGEGNALRLPHPDPLPEGEGELTEVRKE